MAGTATSIFPQTIKSTVQQILPADTTTVKSLYVGATNGSRIENIIITSTSASLRDLVFYITVGGTDYLLTTVSCPVNAGATNAIFPLNLFSNVALQFLNSDPSGNRYLYLDSNATLKCKTTLTLLASTAITFHVQAGDY